MLDELGKQIETLFEGALEYGKTTIELAKLKTVDRISDLAAAILTRIISSAVLLLFFLFISLGLALWLGDIIGKIYLGFFVLAGVYGLLGILIQLFLSKWIKRRICNYIIKNILY